MALKSFADLMGDLLGTRDGVLPSIQAFPPIDTDQLARELDLNERAARNGGNELPAATAIEPDLAEMEIQSAIQLRVQKAAEDYRTQMELYDGRIRRALITVDQRARIEAAGQNGLADFKARTVVDLDHLHEQKRALTARDAEYQSFRNRHRLDRMPIIVLRSEQIFRLLVIGILIIAESVLNGTFFAKGSDSGLVGGLMQALILSAINVGAALLYALYGFPWALHRNPLLKTLGVLATVSYIGLLLAVNLCIAHFRDLYAESGTVLMPDLLAGLTASPLSLKDTQSWLLLFMGIGASVLALIDASGLRDAYPGYGAVGARREQAVSAYAHQKERYVLGLQDLRGDTVQGMQDILDLMRSSEYDLSLCLDGRNRLHRNYVAFLLHVQNARELLIKRYREKNMESRSTPSPAYFQEPPRVMLELDPPGLATVPGLADDKRSDVVELMERYIKEVNKAFSAAIENYQSVAQLHEQPVLANAAA